MRIARVLILLSFLFVPWLVAQADKWHFSRVDRIVAIGDVHGAYEALVATLQAAEVIDNKRAWSGGKTHLVFTGDLLDRGANSRQVMDLVMRLEREAKRKGGRVHLVLGNHEIMNLNSDLRYVADGEYAAYRDLESAKEREFWFEHLLSTLPEGTDEAALRTEFDAKTPPGFFGHRKAFRYDGKYGKWLLKKPFIVVINDTAFVHGGLSPYVAEHGLKGVNGELKNDVRDYMKERARLADARVLSPIYLFKEAPDRLLERHDAGEVPADYFNSAQRVLDLRASPLFGPRSPTWYRGTALCNALVEGDVLAAAFEAIGARRVVMGHTSTVTRTVQQRLDGRVVEIDTGMLREVYRGSGNALVIEGERLTVVNQDGRTDLTPIAHPVRVGHESHAFDDAGLASLLAHGDIVELDSRGTEWRLLKVTTDTKSVFAYFREIPDDQAASELAAFKLDRMLGLGMIPVTVRRELDGQPGTLQFVPAETVTERERVALGRGRGASCSVDKQVAAMRVFDALIGNTGRTPSTMLYSPDEWELILVDHATAFGTDAVPSALAEESGFVVGKQWQVALQELDDGALRAGLGDVLDEPQLSALGQRRDTLLGD